MASDSAAIAGGKGAWRLSRAILATGLTTLLWLVGQLPARAEGANAPPEPETAVSATAFYYSMRDQPDFGAGVVAVDRGSLHVEARYNYEDIDAASAFVGWKFAGGGDLSYEVTPILGLLFGSVRGVIPGVEASVAYGAFDASIEAEYVHNRDDHNASYFYTWNELGWSPREWLRLGLAGQRTRAIQSSRELERGPFVQVTTSKLQFGVYVFNPDLSSRYVVASFGVSF